MSIHAPRSPFQVELPPTYEAFVFMMCDALLYGLLAWYLDAVIRGRGVRSTPSVLCMLSAHPVFCVPHLLLPLPPCREPWDSSQTVSWNDLSSFPQLILSSLLPPSFPLPSLCRYFPFQLSYWFDWLPWCSPQKKRTHSTGRSSADLQGDQESEDDETSPLLGRVNVRGRGGEGKREKEV